MKLSRQTITDSLLQMRIVVIVRLTKQSEVKPAVSTLVEGGVEALEITSNTPGFAQEIAELRDEFPNILIGAGTITTPELAHQAIVAGAQFLVTPNTNKDIILLAHDNDIPVLMGAMTPTEIALADAYGADIIKLFPASVLGQDYVDAIRGPFRDVKIFAVGGINFANLHDWLNSNIDGVGVGGELCKPITSAEHRAQHLAYVKTFTHKVRQLSDS